MSDEDIEETTSEDDPRTLRRIIDSMDRRITLLRAALAEILDEWPDSEVASVARDALIEDDRLGDIDR
jgi:hypothetical protein